MKPKGYTFTEGRHPHRPGTCEFKIPTDLIERYLRYGPAHKFFDLHILPHVLMHPAAVFEGLEREEQQGGLCYAGIPPFIRRESKAAPSRRGGELALIQLPPPPGMTFAVFMTARYVIFDWRWEPADANHPGHPIRWELRFNKRLWPT